MKYYVAPGRSVISSAQGKVLAAGEFTAGDLGIEDAEGAEKRLEALADKGALIRVAPGALPEDELARARAALAAEKPGPLEPGAPQMGIPDPVSTAPPAAAPSPPAPAPPIPAPVATE